MSEDDTEKMIQDILRLLAKFIRTEIIGAVELMVWLAIKNNDFYLLLWNTDYVRPAMALGLISIPLISAIQEYQEKKRDINQIISKIKFSKYTNIFLKQLLMNI